MSFDFVPAMYAVEVGLLLIATQLIAAVVGWRSGNLGLLVVSSSITIAIVSGFLASILVTLLALPFSAFWVAMLVAINVAGAHAFFAQKGLLRYAEFVRKNRAAHAL